MNTHRVLPITFSLLAFSAGMLRAQIATVDRYGRGSSTEALAGASGVIVGLRLPWKAEGFVTAAERGEQRLAIAAAQARLMEVLRGTGAEVVHSYETIPFQALSVTPAALAFLLTSDLVSSIEPDRLWRTTLAESVPLIQADKAWALGVTGAGVAVAILDTGVEATHPFLSGRVVAEACFSRFQSGQSSSLCPNRESIQVGPGAANPVTCAGIEGCDHGTHVAGIAAGFGATFSGVAKGASVIAVKVFAKFPASLCGGAPCIAAYNSDVLRGMEHVFGLSGSYPIAAVNMSLGGGLFTSESECDGSNPSTKALIDNLQSVGIATVISSGNAGSKDGISAPACISTAIAVGSTTKQDQLSPFSNSSPMVDLLAPGSSINSSVTGNGFAVNSGTSMAAPHVTGAWAILKQLVPNAPVWQALYTLAGSGRAIPDFRNGVTRPRIDVRAALQGFLGTQPTIVTDFPRVTEGNAGATTLTFSLFLSLNYLLPVTVDYATSVGTGVGIATAGEDFIASQGRLVFPPGTTTRTIGVPILGDYVGEGYETVRLELSNPVNAALLSEFVDGIIDDDDGEGIAISDAAVTEPRSGTANAVFTVTIAASTIDRTVDFHTTDGSATAPADYEATAGTLTFAADETTKTIVVPVKANGVADAFKTFHVDLENSSGPPIARARGTATISDPGFYAVAPCRVLDTRGPQGPALSAGNTRTVVVGRTCAIPLSATAASLNVTVVSPTGAGDLRIFPAGVALPLVSAINYGAGQTRANNVTVQLSPTGLVSVFCEQATGTVDLIVDVNGYFE